MKKNINLEKYLDEYHRLQNFITDNNIDSVYDFINFPDNPFNILYTDDLDECCIVSMDDNYDEFTLFNDWLDGLIVSTSIATTDDHNNPIIIDLEND